jgi:hypothetical protein
MMKNGSDCSLSPIEKYVKSESNIFVLNSKADPQPFNSSASGKTGMLRGERAHTEREMRRKSERGESTKGFASGGGGRDVEEEGVRRRQSGSFPITPSLPSECRPPLPLHA